MLIATLLYGRWRVVQSSQCIEQGPLIGSVQSNVPQTVKDSAMVWSDEEIFQDAIKESKAAAEAGAKLIVWPETMVQAVLDKKVLKLLDPSSIHRTFDDALKQHAKDTAYVLVGATGGNPHIQNSGKINLDRYNSAFLYTPDGQQADQQYNKIHLVPFGEVVPFKKAAPWLHRLLMKFTPYDFDYSLEYGDEYTVFTADGSNGPYKFSVMICYEDTIPEIARNFCIDENGLKQLDWLINISNDGWFVRFTDKGVFPSTELAQHAAICVFRAVENRIAVLRSVNTGLSCLIDSVGRIRDDFEAGSLPHQAMKRTGMAGWFVDKVPIDKRVTFFSRFGQWLDLLCVICFVLVILLYLFGRFFLANSFKGRFNEEQIRRK
jgi:apolipoprotein N-acyltransferase